MRAVHVVESKVWKHKVTGRTVSIYGAVPWNTSEGKANWELVPTGFNLFFDNNTVGSGRPPYATREEAEAALKANHARLA